MSTSITSGVVSVVPLLVVEYAIERETNTIVHEVIGSSIPDVSLRPAASRAGRLTAVFVDRAAATTLEEMLSAPQVLAIASDDEPRLNGMSFVVAPGTVAVQLQGSTWVVSFPFREVTA